jgi:hypothetical protein
MKKVEFICILLNHHRFIAILDENIPVVEHRVIDTRVMQNKFTHLNRGCLFLLTMEIGNNSIIYITKEADISTYIRIVNNQKLMSHIKLYMVDDDSNEIFNNLYGKAEELRDIKINKILK